MSRIWRLVTWDRLLYGVLLVAVAWLPWPLGSNRPWAWALAEVTIFVALGLALLLSHGARHALQRTLCDYPLVFALFGAWIGYQWLQTADLGPTWLTLLAPASEEVYASTAVWAGERAYSIAFDHASVIDEALKNLLYVALLLTVVMVASSRKRLATLAGVIVGAGLLQGFYGLAGYFTNPYGFPASGSFVNRNHYAALIALAFSVGLGLLYPALGGSTGAIRKARHRIHHGFELMMGWQSVVLAVLVILSAALIFSQSRGGTGALLGGVAIMTTVGVMLRDNPHAERRMLVVVALVVAAAVAWLGTGGLVERLGLVSEEGKERLELWRFSLNVIREHPWFGVGADNYGWVVPAYRDFIERAAAVNHAHNDYLELMAEQGLLGGVLVGVPVLLILGGMLDGYRRRHDQLLLGILFGALTAATAFLLHAVVEFNFQIPANAAYFFIVLGMGLAAARVSGSSRIGAPRGRCDRHARNMSTA